MIPTLCQIRDGRALTGLSQADLAEAAGVGAVELTAHMPMLTRRDAAAIQEAFEAAGVESV